MFVNSLVLSKFIEQIRRMHFQPLFTCTMGSIDKYILVPNFQCTVTQPVKLTIYMQKGMPYYI